MTKGLPWIIEEWPKLLDREESTFLMCVKLDGQNRERTPKKSTAVREWWTIANAVIWMFVRTRAQHNHELEPFPAYTFGRLANIAEELGNGIVPKLVSDTATAGRPTRLAERHVIAYGILYIEAVRRGEIADKAPNKTVRQAYNVTARAVQKWVKKRDQYCVGVPHKSYTPEKLVEKMRASGAQYLIFGRGAPSDN